MRELAEVCGMSAGALYHYFGSKEEILYSIVQSATSEQVSYLQDFVNKLSNTSPTTALVQLIHQFCRWHDDNQDLTLFNYQESKNLPKNALKSIFESEGHILSMFEQVLIKGSQAGEFEVDAPKFIAHNIVMLGHSWALRRWYLRKIWTFEEYLKNVTDSILKLVAAQEARK
jgi:AcrR family transcriptional regulator